MVVRDSCGKIHAKHLLALVQYARMIMSGIEKDGLRGKGNIEKKKQLVAKWMNPKAFKKVFEGLKEKGVLEKSKCWVGVDCPIEGA